MNHIMNTIGTEKFDHNNIGRENRLTELLSRGCDGGRT